MSRIGQGDLPRRALLCQPGLVLCRAGHAVAAGPCLTGPKGIAGLPTIGWSRHKLSTDVYSCGVSGLLYLRHGDMTFMVLPQTEAALSAGGGAVMEDTEALMVLAQRA